MNNPLKRVALVASLVAAAVFTTNTPAPAAAQMAATVYAVTTTNNLISFAPTTPGTTIASTAISGLVGGDGEVIVGIDFRPFNDTLIALSSANRMYVLNTSTGVATPIGNNPLNPALEGANFGFDFNPTVDRIRLVSDSTQNLRLNPLNGAVAATDGALSYAPADVNSGATPRIVASAYTNNFAGSTATVLFNIDSNLDVLVTQNPPNNGTLNTVGALGVDAGELTSFDIMSDVNGTDNAFAAINGTLYTINLANGAATAVGAIAGGSVRAMAITNSVRAAANVPLCADFSGSTSPIVRADLTSGGVALYCRVLAENGTFVGAGAAQIGDASVISRGVIQAVDIFAQNGVTNIGNGVFVCLQGTGTLLFLNAAQAPRTPQATVSEVRDGYTCTGIPNTGTLVLVRQ